MDAALRLNKLYEAEGKKKKVVKTASDQFSLAALDKPRDYLTRVQKTVEDEKSRWVRTLADLLRCTETRMERLLVEKAENSTLLGGGRRASTLRDRVRAARTFLPGLLWNSVSDGIDRLPCIQTV